jgi:hypothetical protein
MSRGLRHVGENDGIDIVADSGQRGLRHTSIPDWVPLSGVSPEAVCLYVLLRIHCEEGANSDTSSIANLMGVNQTTWVDRWCRELASIGAISITATAPGRCVYRVNYTPPADYEGALALGEYRDVPEEADQVPAPWRRPARRPEPVVYYLRRGNGDIKVGHSTNLTDRVRRLRFDHGPLGLLATEPGTGRLERQRHADFAGLRQEGEWFRPGHSLLRHIEMLAS